jgi:GSH-dependent disulfide-bond oxidoreductase
MITQYTWPTPNGHKVSILIEELGLENEIVAVDINTGDQFDPGFLALSPNNRIPAIVDHHPADGGEPVSLFETGAIMVYLAEKEGRFLPGPDDIRGRKAVMEWLMWQMGGLGPMAGQAHHFRQTMGGVDVPYGVERYSKEVRRLYGVMNARLAGNEWLGGADCSIADMACWPWARPSRRQGVDKAEFPDVKRWFEAMSARPGVQAGMELLADQRGSKTMTDETRDLLFGKGQFERD